MLIGCVDIDIKLTITTHGRDVSWIFGTCWSYVDMKGSVESHGNVARTHTERCCLEPGEYNLVCKDAKGDGWDGAFIEINEKRYCDDFRTGFNVTKKITIGGKNIH